MRQRPLTESRAPVGRAVDQPGVGSCLVLLFVLGPIAEITLVGRVSTGRAAELPLQVLVVLDIRRRLSIALLLYF